MCKQNFKCNGVTVLRTNRKTAEVVHSHCTVADEKLSAVQDSFCMWYTDIRDKAVKSHNRLHPEGA